MRLRRCHNPNVKCQAPAIKAHSIQNGKVLELLQVRGKVHMMQHRLGEDGPEVSLQLKGRNDASTFTGLCSRHDAELFEPIDTRVIDPNDYEQMFLCAYRSVLRELHVIMEGAAQAQSLFRKAVESGVESEDCTGPIGKRATSLIVYSYQFYLYKFHKFDATYRSRRFNDLEYDTFTIDHNQPTVAVSSVYSFSQFTARDYAPTILNVFPIGLNRSIVSFCYAKEHSSLARSQIQRVIRATGDYQKYELSRLIIAHAENFVVSPKFVSGWTPDKLSAIERAFRRTMGPETEIGEGNEFMLF